MRLHAVVFQMPKAWRTSATFGRRPWRLAVNLDPVRGAVLCGGLPRSCPLLRSAGRKRLGRPVSGPPSPSIAENPRSGVIHRYGLCAPAESRGGVDVALLTPAIGEKRDSEGGGTEAVGDEDAGKLRTNPCCTAGPSEAAFTRRERKRRQGRRGRHAGTGPNSALAAVAGDASMSATQGTSTVTDAGARGVWLATLCST